MQSTLLLNHFPYHNNVMSCYSQRMRQLGKLCRAMSCCFQRMTGGHGVHDNELLYPELFLVDSLNTIFPLDQDFLILSMLC